MEADWNMARKRTSLVNQVEETVEDMANAVSYAATGTDIGTIESAIEEDLKPKPARRRAARKKAVRGKAARKTSTRKTSTRKASTRKKPARKKAPRRTASKRRVKRK